MAGRERIEPTEAAAFRANQAKAVYRSLGVTKKGIECRRPWQNFHEKALSVKADVAARTPGRLVVPRRRRPPRRDRGTAASTWR